MFRTVFALALCLFSLPAFALCNGPGFDERLTRQERTELDLLAATTPFGEGLFWQATRDGATLILVGTMHLPDARHDPLIDQAMDHMANADLLLVEATLDDQAAIQKHLAENAHLITITEGPSLIDRLDPVTWKAVSEAASSRGMPPFLAAKMQPWFLTMTLAMPPCAMGALASGDGGLDNELMRRAAGQIPVAPLEPWQAMLDLMSSGTFEEQLDALRLSLVDPDLQDALIVTMLDSYFDRRPAYAWHVNRYTARFVPGLDQAQFDAEFAAMEELFLTIRNRSWIPVIEEAATDHETVMVAFGAAHLVGEDGVLSLLESDGWQITRLD